MNWPKGSHVLAAELSQAVIDALCPGDIPGAREAICASWLSIPVKRKYYHVVVGDGSLSTCRYPGEVKALIHAIADLLLEHGTLAIRSYVRPQEHESVTAVMDDLFGAKGMTVDAFKMRLYLAMQRTPQEGVSVREAVRILESYDLSPRNMQDWFGWSRAAVEPFYGWRTSHATYSFPTIEELLALLNECFDRVCMSYPTYELGHCCPTLVMRSL